MSTGNLLDVTKIAQLAAVSEHVINNWRTRFETFPRPVKDNEGEPLWDQNKVQNWLNSTNKKTHVLSFINLKGGVGKTTTAVAVAEMIAHEDGKQVLIIDLDPQTNATVTLISEDYWAIADKAGCTIAQLFEDRIDPSKPAKFDIERAIIRNVSTINNGIARLHLLPSSIRLIDIQDSIPTIAMKGNYNVHPLKILQNAIEPVVDRFDYIIIDCPPSLGPVTKNGLQISTGYVIPTIPDILSTWGIYQIVENLNRLSTDMGRTIPAIGIVATKVQQNKLHNRVIADLRGKRLGRFGDQGGLSQPPLFASEIPQTVDVARSADEQADIRTLKGKYGVAYEPLHGLTQEIKHICEMKNH
jgi:chromosome partitioning protein